MKTISFIKNNFIVLMALSIVIGFSSFKFYEIKPANDHWFKVTSSGNFGAYIGTSTSLDCQEPDPGTPLCAVRLNDNQVDNPTTSPQPKPGITPAMAAEKRYESEDQ